MTLFFWLKKQGVTPLNANDISLSSHNDRMLFGSAPGNNNSYEPTNERGDIVSDNKNSDIIVFKPNLHINNNNNSNDKYNATIQNLGHSPTPTSHTFDSIDSYGWYTMCDKKNTHRKKNTKYCQKKMKQRMKGVSTICNENWKKKITKNNKKRENTHNIFTYI